MFDDSSHVLARSRRVLAEHVLPALVAERRAAGELRLTIWSAGCAEGQEPFSLAMVLDRLLPDLAAWEVTILGTDINEDALEAARAGVYSDWAFSVALPMGLASGVKMPRAV